MIPKYISLDEGMIIMDEAITKAKKIIEGYPETKFSGEEYQRFFEYLDRFFIPQNGELESLHVKFGSVQFSMQICQEREGLQIDYILLKNVVDMFVEFGDSDYGGSNYYRDFEMIVLADNSNYYSRLASEWLPFDSSTEYINKVFWCLNREKQSASHYLHPGSEAMILQNVRYHLLHKVANKLIEKKQAENSGLVTDHQEMLSKCAGMSLQEGSSSTSSEEWLSKLMESSTRIG
ncbi:hypothetical protein CCACVL1_19825 [Corchorus capsularis]|uniref:Cullin N-terminal domain-containing protein n=1 Tax=Corchorus capsularis TaxID=210143 RepID=A0A1R3HEV4_COCAP|nr:hypothetical protein CCACVL1_19825 [Corchorus capsularis]